MKAAPKICGMIMSKNEKKTMMSIGRRRYAQIRGKKARGAFLDEFCALTGLSRKRAIRALKTNTAKRAGRRGRPPKFSAQAASLLAKAWKLAGKPCGKLLRPVIATYVGSLRRHGEVDEAAGAEVLRMSASSMDRLLRRVKPLGGRRWGRHDSLGEHRRKIGLKQDVWPCNARALPGWVEVDTVAHCGGSMSGNFMWTLTCCEVSTQWIEMRPAWNKGAHAVCGALKDAFAAMPFTVLGVNTDNGPEFLNAHLAREFPWLCPGAVRSRSRPYVKNDNPYVEQKNGHAVRRILGYGRIDCERTLDALGEWLCLESLHRNLFRATFRLLEKSREGSRWRKRFEKEPKTPAQRLLDDSGFPEERKERLRALLATHDPVTLSRRIDAARTNYLRLQNAPSPSPHRNGGNGV